MPQRREDNLQNNKLVTFKRILVVCVGNICRSPVALAFFRDKVNQVEFDSAGINAATGQPAAPDSVQYAKAYGIDLSSHSAKQLNSVLLKRHDLILVMEQEQISIITKKYPFTYGKVYLLGHWENKKEIYDPFGKVPEAHKKMVEEVYQSVTCWQKYL